MLDIIIDSKTITGRRANNEDTALACKLSDDTCIIAVADGMGGAAGGEIASSLVIFQLKKFITEAFTLEPHLELKNLKLLLSEAFHKAQLIVAERIREEPELAGMGSTLTCLLVHKGVYVWGCIGDSRIYRLNGKECQLITKDHTYIQELKDKQSLEPDNETVIKYSHILTRVIDGGKDVPDIYPLDKPYESLVQNDLFLICSDGLIENKAVDNTEFIRNTIISSQNIPVAAENLVNAAFSAGSADNITVALMFAGDIVAVFDNSALSSGSNQKTFPGNKPLRKNKNKLLLVSIISLSAILIAAILTSMGAFSGLFDNNSLGLKIKGIEEESQIRHALSVDPLNKDIEGENTAGDTISEAKPISSGYDTSDIPVDEIHYTDYKDEITDLISKGEELYNQKKFDEAIQKYKKALDHDPSPLNISMIKDRIKMCAREADQYRKSVELGDDFMKKKDYNNAILCYTKALSFKPGDKSANGKLVEAQKKFNEHKNTVPTVEKAESATQENKTINNQTVKDTNYKQNPANPGK
jgi:protein phosphatase